MKKIFLIIFITLIISSSYAQDDWKFSGQLQLRSELDGRDFSNRTHPLTFASMRTRVGVEKTFMDKVNFFVQLQDSRVFGEEQATLNAIDNIDLHQGYVKLMQPFEIPADVQAGRFEMAYGTERFFGAVGWHYIGRSWDGIRLSFKTSFKFDFFALTHSESSSYIGNAIPGIYPPQPVSERSQSVYGIWTTFNFNSLNKLDLFGYYNKSRNIGQDPEDDINQATLGINHTGNYGSFSTITEAAYQFGDINIADADISAYLFSLQAFYSAGAVKLGIGADILSGTDESSTEFNTFSVDFGTNHKFYGFMDYFINIPGNTRGSGLNDLYLTASIAPVQSQWSGSVNIHHFMANKERTVFEYNDEGISDIISSSSFGQEIDLTLKYDFIKGTAITWGGSIFFPDDLMVAYFSNPGSVKDDPAFWTYVMITANL